MAVWPDRGAGDALALGLTGGLIGEAHGQDLATFTPTLGRGGHVVVLGAGIAGLTAAYELEQAGFQVTLLEARNRVGGRAWTVRDGDTIEMIGEATQTATFADEIYSNAGPARIPSFHQGLIGYAKTFGVPLEVEVNSIRSAYVMGENGGKLRMRTAVNDMRGHIAELLAKAINQGALDQAMSAADKQMLMPFLKAYGDLDDTYAFVDTERSGFGTAPGAGVRFASAGSAVPIDPLLANERLPMTLFDDTRSMQATMFEPVGGMDRIHAGFDRNLRRPAIRGAATRRAMSLRRSPRITSSARSRSRCWRRSTPISRRR